MGVARIDAKPGTPFNPEIHQAVQMDENATGDHEVVAEELQAGYTLNEMPVRHAMVKVTRK
jgi:molecular chaperone GrpE (heat shock protein)